MAHSLYKRRNQQDQHGQTGTAGSTVATFGQVKELLERARAEIAAVANGAELEKLRLGFLGRKGILPLSLRELKDRTPEEKRSVGPALNQARQELEDAVSLRAKQLKSATLETLADTEKIDVTEPLPHQPLGHLHPTEQIRRQVEDIFRSMGFEVVRGQEVDDEENNFDLLNIPAS
ncbi:MAG: hypothetical protein V1895_03245, partial [Parcubacteria group bacterium]